MNRISAERRFETWQVTACLLALAGTLSCGVEEFPYPRPIIDTSNDLGPMTGTGGTPSTGSGGVPGSGGAPTGGGGVPASGGGAPTGGGGFATGGTPPSGTGGAPTGGAVATGGTGTGTAGSPPASGITITLGGVNVPKEKAVAFIHVGHSNMAGQAKSPGGSRSFHYDTAPRAFVYRPGSVPSLAREPTAGGPFAGPGTALVKEAAMAAPDYYFISLGYGQPSAYCSQFLPPSTFYTELIEAPKAVKDRVTFGGIFLYFGITERRGKPEDINGFSNCINALVTNIRNDVGVPNLPVLMNDYEVDSTGEFAVGGAIATAIMPQIAKCPSVVSNFALVSADDIPMEDDHHFDFDGQRMWVQRAFAKMKEKGWRFWAP
jgi:hypothetical protein